jgi:hypothetical protein
VTGCLVETGCPYATAAGDTGPAETDWPDPTGTAETD